MSLFTSQSFMRRPLRIGDYISNIQLEENESKTDLYSLITDHLVIFCLTTECSICFEAIEALPNYFLNNPSINNAILMMADDEDFILLKEYLSSKKVNRVYRVPKVSFKRKLRINYYPIGIGVNKLGQVISIGPCAKEQHFETITTHFKTLINPKGSGNNVYF